MTAFCVRGRMAQGALHWLSAAILVTAFVTHAIAQEPIEAPLDQGVIMKLPERAATVVIGDPLIADISIQPGGLAVITGRSYGATNFIVMDHDGAVLLEKNIEVTGPIGAVVVVYRGVARNTYSCAPECQPRITLGDDKDYFDRSITQAGIRTTQALAAGATSNR